MRRISKGKVGLATLGNIYADSNTLKSINANEDIVLTPDGSGDVRISNGKTLYVDDVTESTSTITGAVQISGGLATAKNITVGNNIGILGGDIVTISNGFRTSGTDYMYMPTGTTASRPGSPSTGMMRFNTSYGLPEVYNGTSWVVMGLKNVDVSSNTSANAFECMWCVSGGLTITLPASPAKGDTVRIVDVTKVFDTSPITVNRNGQRIQGDAANMTVSTEGAAFDLIYYNATYGWRIFTV